MAAAGTAAPTGRTAWARNLAAPIRSFLDAETGGALVLVAAAVAALVWANSPWPDSYESFWTTHVTVAVGTHALATDLRGLVNEGLMTLFFLVVGLEAKRELDLGELRERSRIAIPVVAGLGGIALATATFVAINAGHPGAHGWGVAVSTDTALALGALALAAPRGATRLRVFLLTLLIIDDLVGLVVIGVAYTEHISYTALAIAAAFFAALISLRWLPRWRTPIAAACAVGLWVALHESGVDAVIAGLLVGLVTSAYPPSRENLERTTELTRSFREQPTPELAYSARSSLVSAISANERLQYRLHPWTSYVIVPVFALANAGVHVNGGLLSDAVRSPITLGIFFGYVVGKPLGVLGASWLASRTGLRRALSWPVIAGGGTGAGIGFTVSVLISSLAFEGNTRQLEEAKLGVLAAAITSALLA